MGKIYTPATIAEIVRRAHEGAGGRTIANDLGLKLASLRVKCSQLGISLRKCRAARAAALEQMGNDARLDLSTDTAVRFVPDAFPSTHHPNESHPSNGSCTTGPHQGSATMNNAAEALPNSGMAELALVTISSLSFKADRADVPLVVMLPRQTAVQLRQCNAAKGMAAEELAAQLLNVIAAEGLYKAILDDDAA